MKNDIRFPAEEGINRPSILAEPIELSGDGALAELLSPEEQEALTGISQIFVVEPDTILYRESAVARSVYNIVSGVAQTCLLQADGSRQITGFFFPGDMLGLMGNGVYLSTAQSITALVMHRIPVGPFLELLERNPRLRSCMYAKAIQGLRDSQNHLAITGKKEASAKLAGFLLYLSRRLAKCAQASGYLSLPMTRYDIGDYLGLSSESVSRAFSMLERERAIVRNGARSIRILDDNLLGRFAGYG